MKILFCHDSFALGGVERRLSQLIIGLNNIGQDELHCLLFYKQFAYPEVLETNVKFHYVSPNLSRAKTLLELLKIIRSISPEIIHTWSLTFATYLNIIKPFVHFKYVCGTIVSANTFNKRQHFYYWEKLSFLLSDCVVSNSKAGLMAKKAPLNKTRVIYNGFNFDRLNNLKRPEEIRDELQIKTPYIITMASRIEPQKNVLMYLQVANEFKRIRNDVTFLMVGEGSQLSYYKDYVQSNSINNIVFTGFRNDVESIINSSNVCVLCSKHMEGVSNSIMEALACGRPVVATLSGGTDEIVLDKKNGFIVNPDDIATMVDRINYLLNNPDACAEMGRVAKKMICDRFLLSSMVNNYVELYKSLISK